MKCQELQIGDYVLVKPSMMPIKVAAVHHKKVGYHAVTHKLNWVRMDLIESIPLTKEILEKSGFYFGYTSNEEDLASNTIAQLSEEDKGWVWDEGDGSIKVMLPNESDGGMIIIDDQSFDRRLSLVYNNEVYVHELQHLLRSCGVEKSLTI